MERYKVYIKELFKGLTEFGNKELCKIFEYYTCIKLYEEENIEYYEYSDISPEFKENHKMSKIDTGIDCSNLTDTIVQCKLRKEILWGNLGTFFGSNIIYSEEKKKPILQWSRMILARNEDSVLSKYVKDKSQIYIDKTFDKKKLIEYCKNIQIPENNIIDEPFILRDYQNECITLITENKKNIVVNLPTGSGKNVIMIHSFQKNKKYLVLFPRIILMEQFEQEVKRFKPEFKIQRYGDNSKRKFDEKKEITLCVYNSVSLIGEENYTKFDKIFIDEAHHIKKPKIYEEIEELDKNKYIEKISSLSKYNNNVLLSATIDSPIINPEINDFGYNNSLYYSKNIRDMIEMNYLSDYFIHIPIFNKDPDNRRICEELIYKNRYIIIYCNSQKEGKEINKLMNSIQDNCSKYIDCNTTKTERQKIIMEYKNGLIPFIVNVRVLTEGFDAPITRGVCFMHLPSSGTQIIQIIGRALRKHPLKTYAKIILPYSTEDRAVSYFIFISLLIFIFFNFFVNLKI